MHIINYYNYIGVEYVDDKNIHKRKKRINFLRGIKQAMEILVSAVGEAEEFGSVPVNSLKDFRRFCESLSIS